MRAEHGIRVAAIVSIVALALVLAGCGGSSKSSTSTSSSTTNQTGTFNTDFKAVTGQFKQASAAIGQAIQTAQSKTNAQLAVVFGGLATRWSSVTSKLSGLTPPGSVSSDFSTMRAAAKRASLDLTQVAASAGKGDASGAQSATRNLVRDILAAKAAATKIDSALGIK
jgi:hypothetical protein